ncbi:hypothetical protein D3C87_1261300 [compost metagenome]
MNKEIESVIFSNVGNRLTQELAMGLIMSMAQIVHQAVQAERQAAAEVAVASSSAPSAGQDAAAAIIDPAYQLKPSPARRSRKPPSGKKGATKPKTMKARR